MIDLSNIIKESKKYHYITFKKDKHIKHEMCDKKQIIKNKDFVIYIKLKTLSKQQYEKEKKSPFKLTGGPLFAEINIYNNGIKEKPKPKNKIFFPKKYLQSKIKKHKSYKWMMNDILKCAYVYYNDMLNQKLIAINNITHFSH
jgi:hypothetical protein